MPLLWMLLLGCPSDPVDTGEPPTAAGYCETTVDLFCPFYLRCGWTSAADEAACRESFLQTCNAVYEPRWQALEAAGLLALDPAGLAACEAHLQTLECGAQQNELQGPCASIWDGQVSAGGACGLGLESFVCDDASVCVIGLDFCGTCQAAAADGQICGDGVQCARESDCVQGLCVARARLGESCDELQPCYVGAACEQGTCVDDVRVGVGDSCGTGNDCPYTSSCLGGHCVADALLGESCAEAACASGWCDGSVCQPFGLPGDPCTEAYQCGSFSCDGTCGDYLSICLTGE